MDKDFSVRDQLTVLTAEIDQAQAAINDARSKYKDDANWHAQLDHLQEQLNTRISLSERLKELNERIDSL